MTDWKEVLWLAKFELKHSIKHLLSIFLLFIISFLLVRSMIPSYLEEPSMGLDFFFVFIIFSGLLSQMARPKDYQVQKFRSIRYAAPFLTALNQMPIKRKVIVKYRFLTYLFLLSLFNGLMLIALYPSFQQVMTFTTYIAFAFIWFCFGIYFGCITPAFEVGTNMGWVIFYSLILGCISFFLYLYIFFKWYNGGFVTWTIDIASNYPVISIIVSLILSIIGWNFWMKVMLKKMDRTDYL